MVFSWGGRASDVPSVSLARLEGSSDFPNFQTRFLAFYNFRIFRNEWESAKSTPIKPKGQFHSPTPKKDIRNNFPQIVKFGNYSWLLRAIQSKLVFGIIFVFAPRNFKNTKNGDQLKVWNPENFFRRKSTNRLKFS